MRETDDTSGRAPADTDASVAGGSREKRSTPRASLKKRAHLMIANGVAIEGRTIDISIGGVGVIAECPLLPGQRCSIRIDASIRNRIAQLTIRGTVAFCARNKAHGFRIGIHADQMDLDLVQYIGDLFR